MAPTPTSNPPRAARAALDSNAVTPVESAILRFLRTLEGADIPIVATCGSRFAPVFRDPKGLQLTCLPRHLDRACRFLEHALESEDVSTVWARREAGTATFQLYAFCGNDRHHHLRLEVSTSRQFRGVPYLTAEEIFRNRDTSRTPQRPAAVTGTLAQFLPGFLRSGHVERESTTRLVTTCETHPAQLRAVLGRMVGTRAADRFAAALREPELSSLIKEAPGFRRALLRKALFRHPLRTLRALTRRLTGGEREDPGFLVAVVGPEGAKAEALAAEMRTELRAPFPGSTYASLRDFEADLPQDTPRGPLSGWWRALQTYFMFRRQFRANVAPTLQNGGAAVVDSWTDSWTLEPSRFGLRPDDALVRWLAARVRRPDVVLVCSPTSTELIRRLPGMSRREALALTATYETFAKDHPAVFEVPCEGKKDPAVGLAMVAALAGMEALTPGAAMLSLSEEGESSAQAA